MEINLNSSKSIAIKHAYSYIEPMLP